MKKPMKMSSGAPPHHLPFTASSSSSLKGRNSPVSRGGKQGRSGAKTAAVVAALLLVMAWVGGLPSDASVDYSATTAATLDSLASFASITQKNDESGRRLDNGNNNNYNNAVAAVQPSPVVAAAAAASIVHPPPAQPVVEVVEETPTLPINMQFGEPPHTRRLRILLGILTADFKNDYSYRKRHRDLFKLWNDPRVCSLPDFKARPLETRYQCEIIYTFVMGGNPEATTELVDQSRPREVEKPIQGSVCPDVNEPDVTLLNIKENMNEGKSQTWMSYGAEIADEYDLDYVTKCDADALLHLHEFFTFAYTHLPPAPYNKHVFVGALRDKAYWPRHKTEEARIAHESYFGNNFEGVHLYIAGQLYIMSKDLAKFVGEEALRNKCSYCEGHEDHDISAMAFHSDQPIKMLTIGRSHRFWEHPVKGEPRWRRMFAREKARMAGEPFEGKLLSKDSQFDEVWRG